METNDPNLEIEMDIFGNTDPRKMPSHMFHGVRFLDYSTAVKADVTKQAGATCPRYWYISADFECLDCKKVFTFPVEEQRFWYEELKFYPGVTPVRCAPCRKIEKKRRLDEQKPKGV